MDPYKSKNYSSQNVSCVTFDNLSGNRNTPTRFTTRRRVRYGESKENGRWYVSVSPAVAHPVKPRPEKLKKSRFNTEEDLSAFAQKFDEGSKRVFFDEAVTLYVKFGGPRDNEPKHGIKAGKLSLTG